MSPQQVREVPLDHRTDIYSLGVVMFELLTGRLPFESDNNYTLLYRIANDTPPKPSELRPEVPEALDTIVRRATERDVEHRYQSWAEFCTTSPSPSATTASRSRAVRYRTPRSSKPCARCTSSVSSPMPNCGRSSA